jgi:uncharacterized membrane protein
MDQNLLSTETCHKDLQFLSQRCDSILLLSEIKISDYEHLKQEYNDFLDRIMKSTDFEQNIKEKIVRQRIRISEIEKSEATRKVLKDGMNIVSKVVMYLSGVFSLGISVAGNNTSEKRRTIIEEIRNNLSQIQFLLGNPSPD